MSGFDEKEFKKALNTAALRHARTNSNPRRAFMRGARWMLKWMIKKTRKGSL